MYENGEKCQGYFRKRLHKKRLQLRIAQAFGYGSYKQFLIMERKKAEAWSILYGEIYHKSLPFRDDWFEAYWRYYSRDCFYDRFEHRQQIRRERHKKIDAEELMPD